MDRFYPLYLLQLIMKEDQVITPVIRLRASIEFKKWATHEWTKPNLQDIQFSEVHIEIKNIIVNVWINSPTKGQEELLRESILAIAKWEFPQRWNNLSTSLMQCLIGDLNQITDIRNFRVFKLLAKLMAKYEYSSRSDELYSEIILVADTTAEYLHHFATTLVKIFYESLPNDAKAIAELLGLLGQVIKCFYYLNCQDMPPKIEDNLSDWMQILSRSLSLNLENLGEDVKIQAFKVKGESLRSILLYFTKYREDVEQLVQDFSQQIYNVCTNTSDDDSSSKFILNAMKYFKNLLYWSDLKSFFAEGMDNLLKVLVFRMEKPTQDDIDVFDTEPDGFIENVLNNAGGSSRKNTVNDLAKALSKNFTEQVVQVLQGEVEAHIMAFNAGNSDRVNEIKLINTLVDMGVSKFTPKMGVTELILPAEFYTVFYNSIVEPTLNQLFEVAQNDQNFNVDSLNLFHVSHLIRYVFFFRNYLDKGKLLDTIKSISFLTKTKNETFKRVLYHSIENLIGIRDSTDIFAPSNFFYNKTNAYPQIQFVLQNIYSDIQATPEPSVYVLRSLFNVIKIMEETAAEFCEPFCLLFKDLLQKLGKAYDFNMVYLVFDSLASFIVYTKDNVDVMNNVYKEIFPYLDLIIKNNNADLLSYAFQIYALAIHFHNLPPDNIKMLFESLMNLNNWQKDNAAMFPAYMMFIEEYSLKQPELVWNNFQSLQNILFTVLIDNQLDQLFFSFVNKIALFWDLKDLRNSKLLNIILQIILKAIFESQNNANQIQKDNKLSVRGSLGKNILLFWSLCIVKFTFEEFLQDIQEAFGNDFNVFYDFLLLEVNIIKQYQRQPERKVIINGMESIIFSSFGEKLPTNLFHALLNAIVENMYRRKKSKLSSNFDGYNRNVVTGYSSNFQKLSWFAAQKLPYSDLPDEDARFVNEFKEKYANMAMQILEQVIDPNLQKFFQELFQ